MWLPAVRTTQAIPDGFATGQRGEHRRAVDARRVVTPPTLGLKRSPPASAAVTVPVYRADQPSVCAATAAGVAVTFRAATVSAPSGSPVRSVDA